MPPYQHTAPYLPQGVILDFAPLVRKAQDWGFPRGAMKHWRPHPRQVPRLRGWGVMNFDAEEIWSEYISYSGKESPQVFVGQSTEIEVLPQYLGHVPTAVILFPNTFFQLHNGLLIPELENGRN